MTDSMNALKLMYLSAFYTLSSMGNALEIGISTTYFFLIEKTECWWEEILGVEGGELFGTVHFRVLNTALQMNYQHNSTSGYLGTGEIAVLVTVLVAGTKAT